MRKKTLPGMQSENAQTWQNRRRKTTMVLPSCRLSSTRTNPGSQQEKYYRAFMRWLLGGRKRKDIAKELRITRSTPHLRFDVFLRDIPAAPTPKKSLPCLLPDGF